MKKGLFTLLLLIITALPALAAPTNTSGPWGISASAFTNLSSALNSPATAGKTVVVEKPMTTNNLTLPSDRSIRIIKGGSINPASGKTFDYNGQQPEAGQYQIHAGAGTITGMKEAYVQWFGAVGDGTTDNTLAFQSALNAGLRVHVPVSSSNYIVGNLTAGFDGQTITGAGYLSCMQLKAGLTGALIDSNGKKLFLKNLRIYGGDDSGKATVDTTEPTTGAPLDRSGVYLDFDIDSGIDSCIIHGFGNRGVKAGNATANRTAGTSVINTHIYNCWAGLDAGSSNAEYFRGVGNSIGGCQIGLISASGNQTYTGGSISDNYINVRVQGTGVSNNTHSSIVGTLINHAALYAIEAIGVTNGFIFDACNIFTGKIYLKNSTGVLIANGIYDIDVFLFEGGGRNVIRNNFSPNSYANGVAHNWNSSVSNSILLDNFIPGGPTQHNSVPIFGFPVYTGPADVPFLQFGTTGLIDKYGYVWTNNANTGKTKLLALTNGVLNTTPALELLDTGKVSAMTLILANYANDVAAATGGIPIGGMYRNGSAIQIRVD